jgi:periplasmic protein TonB
VIDENPAVERRRLGIALGASIAMHALLVLLIAFTHRDQPLPKKQTPQVMDVVMLPNTQNLETPPKNARAISNRNAIGSSRNAKDNLTRAARSPIVGNQQPGPRPAPPTAPRTPPPLPEPVPEQRTRTLTRRDLALNKLTPKERLVPRKPEPKHPPLPKIPMSDLMPSSMALAELSRDFQRERRLKDMLNKSADIPINTRQVKYAPYAHSLVQALEEQWQPGQADYGAYTADDRKVLMKVTINGNGDLGGLEILRPSPIRELNDSAVAAVHAAAPFRPLPSSWGLDRVSFYLTFEIVNDRYVFHAY